MRGVGGGPQFVPFRGVPPTSGDFPQGCLVGLSSSVPYLPKVPSYLSLQTHGQGPLCCMRRYLFPDICSKPISIGVCTFSLRINSKSPLLHQCGNNDNVVRYNGIYGCNSKSGELVEVSVSTDSNSVNDTYNDSNTYIFFYFIFVCFTRYLVFRIAVLPHRPGVVYYHVLLRRETRTPGVAPFSFRIGIWDIFVHRGQKSYTPTAFGKLWTTPGVRCMKHASS